MDAEVVGGKVEEVEEEVEEDFKEEVEVTKAEVRTLVVRGLNVKAASDEGLLGDIGTGSPLDITLPHGSSPKTWPTQPQLERQELTQLAPLQRTFFSGCCTMVLFELLLVS